MKEEKILSHGDIIELENNEQLKIINEIGRGGRSIVYLCEFQGDHYALKWYTHEVQDVFYNNLKTNIQNGPPKNSSKFLWPLMLTKKQNNCFGYVMPLLPKEYTEFGDYLSSKANFASVGAILNAAIQICEGMKQLFDAGYSYADFNDGCIFIHPETGDVLFADTDIIAGKGVNLAMMGIMRYTAPEMILGQTADLHSNYFSQSVILFQLFFRNHPLEGQIALNSPCMTEDGERKYYGIEALFIYDKENQGNPPVKGIHNNVIKLWPLYPEILRNAFTEAFSQESLKNPSQRFSPAQWQSIFVQLRNNLIVDANGNEGFLADNEKAQAYLKWKDDVIALVPGKTVYIGISEFPFAKVKVKRMTLLWELQNMSNKVWEVETPSGKIKEVAHNELMPVKSGLKISCDMGLVILV